MKNKLTVLMEQSEICGVSAATIDNKNENFYLGFMGNIPPFDSISVADGMLYDLASLTKVIGTTTRILQLIDADNLELQSPVSEVFSEFPRLTMTIEDLLLHRGGLPADFSDKQLFTEVKFLTFLENFKPTNSKKTIYSDLGFLLLGLIIERIDKQELNASFKKNIFEPLGMKRTFYYPDFHSLIIPTEVTKKRGIIVGAVHDSKAYQWPRPVGSAGLFSTLEDMRTFASSIILNKKADNSDLFSAKMLTLLKDTNVSKRTFGWEKPFREGILYHTGFTGTSIGIDLVKKRALVLLTNRIHPTRDKSEFITNRVKLYRDYFKEVE